jgi:hypothetical protein
MKTGIIERHQSHSSSRPTYTFLTVNRATEGSERLQIEEECETDSQTRGSSRLDWEMIAIWSFVLFNFAALFFAMHVIWTKCHGGSLFWK